MENSLFYTPHLPNGWGNVTCNSGQKILILGESHYGEVVNKNFTCEVINEVISGSRPRGYIYYTRLSTLIDGYERSELFQNTAFSNLIQNSLLKPRVKPEQSDLDEINTNFHDILEFVQPKKIIITSIRAWYNWIDKSALGVQFEKIQIGNRNYQIAKFQFQGNEIQCIAIAHPSTKYAANYRPLINHFINL